MITLCGNLIISISKYVFVTLTRQRNYINFIGSCIKIIALYSIHFMRHCCPPGWLCSPLLLRNNRKNLTISEGCHFAWFYILIWWSFPKIETKNFNLDPYFSKLVKMEMISPAAHFLNCVHIGRSQSIAAIICGLSPVKRFVKLREVF